MFETISQLVAKVFDVSTLACVNMLGKDAVKTGSVAADVNFLSAPLGDVMPLAVTAAVFAGMCVFFVAKSFNETDARPKQSRRQEPA